jgi:hypothetical protein
MEPLWTTLKNNAHWIFEGIGVWLLGGLATIIWIVWNVFRPASARRHSPDDNTTPLEHLKGTTHILFIDDDTTFRVVNILQKSGWLNTRIVSDLPSLSDNALTWAHILFIDINGVGREAGFQDEGLGLALAIKRRYPSKKVIIYSADTRAERFHDAWKEADEYLPKNSDAYQFEEIVETFAKDIAK